MRLPLPVAIAVLACGSMPAMAQLPNADLLTVFPPVARAGETTEVTISGDHILADTLTGLHFDDGRIKGLPLLRAEDDFYSTRQPDPYKFTVTVPPGVPPGIAEVRSSGHFGLSTARPFLVVATDSIEAIEEGDHSTRELALPLAIETGISGTVDTRKIDWYRFSAKKDERLLAQLWGERLDSRIDGMLSLYDAEGRELESKREHFGRDPLIDFTAPADGDYFLAVADILYRGGKESFYRLKISRAPHIDFIDPPAGMAGTTSQFTVYGRNLPGGSLAEGVALDGKPLESVEVEITVPEKAVSPRTHTSGTPRCGSLPAFDYQLAGSNSVRIGFATAALLEEDDTGDSVQVIPPACEIVGRFSEPGDSDRYRFTTEAGKTYWIELISEQLGASTDGYLRLEKVGKDEAGKETLTQVAENDDPPSFFDAANLDATYLDTLDPQLKLEATEEAATYQITLLNQLGGGGATHRYRLAIRQARPDFQVLTTTERNLANGRAGYPAAPLLRRGGSIVYRVVAPRRDGFDGEIVVRASPLPEGVTAKPLRLFGKTEEGFLTLVASKDAPAWQGPIEISGTAELGGEKIRRKARNAALVWGNVFADSRRVRSRLDKQIVLSVSDHETAPAMIAADGPLNQVWQVRLNESLKLPVKVTDLGTRKGNLTVQVHGFPTMKRSPPSITIAEGKTDGELSISFKPSSNFEIEPGRYQFVLQGIGIARYRYHPENAEHLDSERLRFIEMRKKLTADFEAATAKQAEAQKALDTAKANAATASAEEKSAIDQRVADAAAALAAATKATADADRLAKRADQLVKSYSNLAAAAKSRAAEKDSKFATFSQPIDVEVLPIEEDGTEAK